MPGMDGRELVEQARRSYPELRVLYSTGYIDAAHDHGIEATEASCIEKPFRSHALASKVRQLLDAA
jgi:two-component system cell cycle sensor histidine kinase/response regulator CckA